MPSNPPRRWPLLVLEIPSALLLLTHFDQTSLPSGRMLPIYLSAPDVRGALGQRALVGTPFHAPLRLFTGEDVDIAVLQNVARSESLIAKTWDEYYHQGQLRPSSVRYWPVGALTAGHGWDWSYMVDALQWAKTDTERDYQRLAQWALEAWDAQTPLADGYRLDMCVDGAVVGPTMIRQGQGHQWAWAWT